MEQLSKIGFVEAHKKYKDIEMFQELCKYQDAEENKQIMTLPDHKIIDQLKIREIIYAHNGNYGILFWNGDREFYRTQDELYQAIVNKLKEDKQC